VPTLTAAQLLVSLYLQDRLQQAVVVPKKWCEAF